MKQLQMMPRGREREIPKCISHSLNLSLLRYTLGVYRRYSANQFIVKHSDSSRTLLVILLYIEPPPSYAQNLAAGRAQNLELPSAWLLSWYDRAKLRSSWRIVVAVLASRETDSRFSQRRATSLRTVTRRHLPRWPGIAWFRHPHGAPLHIHHLLSLVQVSC